MDPTTPTVDCIRQAISILGREAFEKRCRQACSEFLPMGFTNQEIESAAVELTARDVVEAYNRRMDREQ